MFKRNNGWIRCRAECPCLIQPFLWGSCRPVEPYEQRILNMEKNTTFTQGKILQPLILFALPVLFALFLQAMYGAVDLLIVGKFAASADVSAVSTGSQIMMTLTNLVSSFAMGTTILLDQQIGCGERKKGGRTVGTAMRPILRRK